MARLITQSSALASGAAIVALVATFACGCSSGPQTAGTTSPEQTAMFERVKSLAGEWTMPDETGKVVTASVYTVTSAGTAVREVMFPGTPHEMTNIYHLDGPSVLVTHYCGIGNQPRMRCTKLNPDGSMTFAFDSVTNLKTPDSMYMGSLTLKNPDPSHLEQVWISTNEGKEVKEHAVFTMTRKGT